MAGATRSGFRKPATRAPAKSTRPSISNNSHAETPAASSGPSGKAVSSSQQSPSAQLTALSMTEGFKRKDRDFEPRDQPQREQPRQTNIHVAVRCRGRNDREVKENSGVVVSTPGVKSDTLELSMGPNALGNKAYQFDKVFSSAADQAIVFEDVVTPMLNEMLAGYNCTIFAYGQTGTGKTYTMSGEMADTLGILSDNAGIIPRVFYSLFQKLENRESSVKCSFIELYNEDLRDLLSSDEGTKLKIYDDTGRRGHTTTMVQGMGETYIHSAHEGIKLLQQGSYRRQVAATQCNDLSSRSHTVFTITVYAKRTTDKGEEFMSSGKLNLVDLAGSENIQRSGAENKRATEAGLINKSLLTLGRVINALVDGNQHIPYRESKLTRLLQDSLGGHTKTCIIATISPARSNMEETISTLDYAFRAKNIRNKPQISSALSKKTLLREFTIEIEKLKSDLIATRQRNGVYLSSANYEDMTLESESRRILTEEQRARIETMEANLRHKVQELLSLTGNFNSLKEDNESTLSSLQETGELLKKTDQILENTKQSLEEETMFRKAHEATESELHSIGNDLLLKLGRSVENIDGLHTKLRRRSDLHSRNRERWDTSTSEVSDLTSLVDGRLAEFQSEQSSHLASLSDKIGTFVESELKHLSSSLALVTQSETSLDSVGKGTRQHTTDCRDEMNSVLEEIKDLRQDVKEKVHEGLGGLTSAARRISEDVICELGEFQKQLRQSYSALGDEFKGILDKIASDLRSKKEEVLRLRQEVSGANESASKAKETARLKMEVGLEEEKKASEMERATLLSNIKDLIENSTARQTSRMEKRINDSWNDMDEAHSCFQRANHTFHAEMDRMSVEEDVVVAELTSSKDKVGQRMDKDWKKFDKRHSSIQSIAKTVHAEAQRIVEIQMEGISDQMQALDGFVTRAKCQNDLHHKSRLSTLDRLSSDTRQSYNGIRAAFDKFGTNAQNLQQDVSVDHGWFEQSIDSLTGMVREPLCELQSNIQDTKMAEYQPTGDTPQKEHIDYPFSLPRTEKHETLLSQLRNTQMEGPQDYRHGADNEDAQDDIPSLPISPIPRSPIKFPTKGPVYTDSEAPIASSTMPAGPASMGPLSLKPSTSSSSLRELDANIIHPHVPPPSSPTPTSPPSAKRKSDSQSNDEENSGNSDITGPAGDKTQDQKQRQSQDRSQGQSQVVPLPPAKRRLFSSPATLTGIAAVAGTGESKLPQKMGTRRRGPLGAVAEGAENMPVVSGVRRRLRGRGGA